MTLKQKKINRLLSRAKKDRDKILSKLAPLQKRERELQAKLDEMIPIRNELKVVCKRISYIKKKYELANLDETIRKLSE